MATRDIQTAIKQGKAIVRKNDRLDLRASEIFSFMDAYMQDRNAAGESDAVYNAVYGAFLMGLAIGTRNA